MSQDNSNLSPDSSPKTLNAAGVKKLNNLPLIIVLSVIVVFALLIAMVALKKSSAEPVASSSIKRGSPKRDTLNLARDVINRTRHKARGNKNVLLPIKSELPAQIEAPSPQVPQMPIINNELSDSEIELIRQEKSQQFKEAVKSKITVSFDKELIARSSQTANYTSQMKQPNLGISFKEQLKLMQRSQNTSQTSSSIGGEESEQRWQLKSKLEIPKTPYELRAGAVIPGVLISGIRSELHGQIIGQVSQDVYDTATGHHLLIPQGAKLFGVYSSDIKFGQDSVLVAWQRLVFPDGKALDIGSMSGSDSGGYAGFRDEVDHHYGRVYGSAILMSGIVAGISYSQNRNQSVQGGFSAPSAGDVLSQALGQQLGQTTSQLIAKNINTAPTINIRPGYEFNVTVTKDLVFNSPYHQFRY